MVATMLICALVASMLAWRPDFPGINRVDLHQCALLAVAGAVAVSLAWGGIEFVNKGR
jgi:hypothetical protein